MNIFFALMVLIGLLMIFLERFGRYNDAQDIGWLGNRGAAAVAIGIVGLACLWVSP